MHIKTKLPRIENHLRRAGVTIDELCMAAGIHRSTWSRWKAGKTVPRVMTWRNVTQALTDLVGDRHA